MELDSPTDMEQPMFITRTHKRAVASLVGLTLIAGIGLAQAESAGAYVRSGCRFPSANINYKFGSISQDLRVVSVTAANQWTNNTDVNMFQSSTYPAITISSANYGNVAWDGQAPDFQVCNGGVGGDKTVRYNTYYNNSVQAWQSVATHEVGHAIGLAHVGSSSTPCGSVAIMIPNTYDRWTRCGKAQPQADDINGINAIY